jgi:hypothetical protein
MRTVAVRTRLKLIPAALLVAGALAIPGSAAGATTACTAPVPSTTQPGYTVADPHCDFGTGNPFVPLVDAGGAAISQVYAGIQDGAAFRIEVPVYWNGELVLYAHGFRGTGTTVWVDNPSLRAYYVAHGFAWAASSYQTNGYDVGQGVRDSHDLIDLFAATVGQRADAVYMTGVSMGGHITAVAIERYPSAFVGAMPACGVLADTELFDYFLDANVTAAALTGTPITYPLQPPPDYIDTYRAQVQSELPLLGSNLGTGTLPSFTPLGQAWGAAVQQRSGGTRPGFASAFAFWNAVGSIPPLTGVPFLFGLYPGVSGGTIGIADGNVASNVDTVYQLDGDPALSPAEQQLNAAALRVAATDKATHNVTEIPAVMGRPVIPVLSMHDLGDLFVPFSMEQLYAERVAKHGHADLFVSRAIRGTGHCDFTQAEQQRAFGDLVTWVRTGQRPAGDDVTDPAKVADPTFGCQFTSGPHANFVAAPCPPA